MQAKTIEEAIKKGAVMVYADDWMAIKDFGTKDIGEALSMVIGDCWNPLIHEELGNGFVGIPNDRSSEIAKAYPGPIAATYRILMHSNVSARKAYIRNNPKLKHALEGMNEKVS